MTDHMGQMSGRGTRRHRMRGVVAALVLLTVAVTGCTSGTGRWMDPDRPAGAPDRNGAKPAPKPHVLAFDATGSGTLTSATYVVDGETHRETAVMLPWRKSITIPADDREHEWRLVVVLNSGDMSLIVTIDDRTLSRGRGSGGGTLTFSGSFTG